MIQAKITAMPKTTEFLAKHPVFTIDEFVEFVAERGATRRRSAHDLLRYHEAQGHVLRVRRGLYASVPVGADADTWTVDSLLLASRLAPDAVVAYHTALAAHALAYSTSTTVSYLARRAATRLAWRGVEYQAVTVPRRLREADQDRFGVVTLPRDGQSVPVTGRERTLVDVLDRPELAGGAEEAWRSLEGLEYVDLEQVIAYALLLDSPATCARVGYFLEQHQASFWVEESHLQSLRERRPRSWSYLDRHQRSGRWLRDWHLVVPEAIADRTWQEVG